MATKNAESRSIAMQEGGTTNRTNLTIAKESTDRDVLQIAIEQLGIKVRFSIKPLPPTQTVKKAAPLLVEL